MEGPVESGVVEDVGEAEPPAPREFIGQLWVICYLLMDLNLCRVLA